MRRIGVLTSGGDAPGMEVFGHRDRILASRLDAAAVDILLEGGGMMAGEVCGRTVRVPLRHTWERRRKVPADLLAVVRDLA